MAIKSKHVLICRTDNIGDVVLTLPIAAQLKAHDPSVKISFLCRAYAAPIVRLCTDIDAVIEWENVAENLTPFLKQSGIDTIIIAQPDRQIAKAAFFARIRHRIGNTRQKLYLLLYCNRGVRFSKGESQAHESQINFEFLKPFGIHRIPTRQEIPHFYHFDIPFDANIAHMLSPHRFNLLLHTKSNGHGREWPIEHYESLARLLYQDPQVHLWLTGSAKEREWIQEYFPNLLSLPNVTSLFGKQSLREFTALIHQADGLIASGTGPLHVAAAVGQRCIGLFPPIKPMDITRWEALGVHAQSLYIYHQLHEGCRQTTAPTCECMHAISPETIFNIVQKWINEKNKTYSTSQSKTA
jgi:ADP-heptose:LPS heptosyltransferase